MNTGVHFRGVAECDECGNITADYIVVDNGNVHLCQACSEAKTVLVVSQPDRPYSYRPQRVGFVRNGEQMCDRCGTIANPHVATAMGFVKLCADCAVGPHENLDIKPGDGWNYPNGAAEYAREVDAWGPGLLSLASELDALMTDSHQLSDYLRAIHGSPLLEAANQTYLHMVHVANLDVALRAAIRSLEMLNADFAALPILPPRMHCIYCGDSTSMERRAEFSGAPLAHYACCACDQVASVIVCGACGGEALAEAQDGECKYCVTTIREKGQIPPRRWSDEVQDEVQTD